MNITLNGKSALVTGAASGIGKAVAEKLAMEGISLVLIDNNKLLLDELTNRLVALKNVNIISHAVDVRDCEEAKRVVKESVRELGSIDFLVNSAGVYKEALTTDMTLEEWSETIDINLTGTFIYSSLVSREMVKSGFGKIVNMSSVAAFRGSIEHAHYTASKAGVIGITKTLALELAPYGITVNCVAPGIIKTSMTEKMIRVRGEDWLKAIPLKRFGTPDEVANVIIFLLSEAASYITGAVIDINGGLYLR